MFDCDEWLSRTLNAFTTIRNLKLVLLHKSSSRSDHGHIIVLMWPYLKVFQQFSWCILLRRCSVSSKPRNCRFK